MIIANEALRAWLAIYLTTLISWRPQSSVVYLYDLGPVSHGYGGPFLVGFQYVQYSDGLLAVFSCGHFGSILQVVFRGIWSTYVGHIVDHESMYT